MAGVRIVDGSGLSRSDRITARALAAILVASWTDPDLRLPTWEALPVAGRDGTLEDRMCGTAAAGRVWAKTGTLDGVRCLAGYTWTRSGRRVTFAFLLAQASYGPSATARRRGSWRSDAPTPTPGGRSTPAPCSGSARSPRP
jgi:D-alanyl-D-alanine carboxypeptidase/D-alanyl-D-alanine-endopeptidase (penicillin-binding protein 4)